MTIGEKRSHIDPEHPAVAISRQCELLDLQRSSYYRDVRCPCQETEENLVLMRLIDEEYMRHPFYGTRKMCSYLRRQGYKVNRKRIQRLMRKMGIASIAPKPNTSMPRKGHKLYPYLLRGMDIYRPSQVWCSDITYIHLSGGFVYLTAVMDCYSRYVLSWEISVSMDDEFCVSALSSALRRYEVPEVFTTDQGSQYTGNGFTGVLEKHGIRISMDGKGRAMDNIFIERLWRSVKYEEVYLKEYAHVKELVAALKRYFDFYNFERPHQTLDGKTPAEVYWRKSAALQAA